MVGVQRSGRASLYGMLLTAAAVLLCWPATAISVTWVAATVYLTAALAASAGFAMTLRGAQT